MKVKLVVGDWNGTWFNDADYAFGGTIAIFEHYKLKPPPKEEFFNQITADFLQCYQMFGVPMSATREEVGKIWQSHFAANRSGGQLRDGTRDLLIRLKSTDVKTAIASGESNSILQRRLNELNIRQLFDLVRGDCFDKAQALKIMASQLRLPLDTIVYIDDNHDGIVAAKIIGAITIGFLDGWQSPNRVASANPNYTARTMHDVRRIVDKLI